MLILFHRPTWIILKTKNLREKKSIIPDSGPKNPKSKINHLSKPMKDHLEGIFEKHKNLFSRSKHHLGRFNGFQAVAQIDQNSKIQAGA